MAKKLKSPKIRRIQLLKVAIRLVKESFKASPLSMILLLVTIMFMGILPFGATYLRTHVLDIVIGIISKHTLDTFTPELIKYVLLVAVMEFVMTINRAINDYFERLNYYNLMRYFTLQFLDKSSTLDMSHYEDSSKNDLIQKAKESYSWRPSDISFQLLWSIRYITELITGLTLIAVFSPLFAFILFLTTLPSLILNIKGGKEVWGIWDKDTKTRRKYWNITGSLSSENEIGEMRVFRSRNYFYDTVVGMFLKFIGREADVVAKRTLYNSLAVMFEDLGSLAFWIYTIGLVLAGKLSVGMMSFYGSASGRYSEGLGGVFRTIARTDEGLRYMVDYYKFMDLENTIVPGTKKLVQSKNPPTIEFRNVDFTYYGADKPILNNFNLTIKPGERIAFVGENGAGKTTIIKLLSRFYDVTGGQILIDGVDIREIDLDSYYQNFGILFQSFSKFNYFQAKKTIGVGDVDKLFDKEKILEAAKKAGAHDFISDLKKGYSHVLSKEFPGGTDLSGGQWQRIALARAFFRDAPVLILDEPTSAIDAKGEYEIFEKLYEFTKGKTVIIVSHRFSTVRLADKIYVIDGGKITEQGSHEQLIALNGKYKKAFELQAKGYK